MQATASRVSLPNYSATLHQARFKCSVDDNAAGALAELLEPPNKLDDLSNRLAPATSQRIIAKPCRGKCP
eukprot:5019012-Amphidinium_carterae.1